MISDCVWANVDPERAVLVMVGLRHLTVQIKNLLFVVHADPVIGDWRSPAKAFPSFAERMASLGANRASLMPLPSLQGHQTCPSLVAPRLAERPE